MNFAVLHQKNYPTSKIVYNHVDEMCSIDLADMTDIKISNNKVLDIYLLY